MTVATLMNVQVPEDSRAALRSLARALRLVTPAERGDSIAAAIVRDGGTLLVPQCGSAADWGPHTCTVSVHGICGMGDTLPEAAQEWLTSAERLLDAQAVAA